MKDPQDFKAVGYSHKTSKSMDLNANQKSTEVNPHEYAKSSLCSTLPPIGNSDAVGSQEQPSHDESTKLFEKSLQTVKSTKSSSQKELMECLKEIENIMQSSFRNFQSLLVRIKTKTLSEVIPPKKGDPDRQTKLNRIQNYKKVTGQLEKLASELFYDQVLYLRFLHGFCSFLVSQGGTQLVQGCESILNRMNQIVSSLARDAISRALSLLKRSVDELTLVQNVAQNDALPQEPTPLQEVQNNPSTHSIPNTRQRQQQTTQVSKFTIIANESERFLVDLDESPKDYLRTVERLAEQKEVLRKSMHTALKNMLVQLYRESGLLTPESESKKITEVSQCPVKLTNTNKCEDESTSASGSPRAEKSTPAEFSTKFDPSLLQPNLKTLLRNWTYGLSTLFRNLTCTNQLSTYNFNIFFSKSCRNSKEMMKELTEKCVSGVRYHQRRTMTKLQNEIKLITSNSSDQAPFPSPVDLLELEDSNYPHSNRRRLLDTYFSYIRMKNTEISNTIGRFTKVYLKILKISLNQQYKLLKHSPSSHESMDILRYHNVQKMEFLIDGFAKQIQTNIQESKGVLLDLSGRLMLDMTTEFPSHLNDYESQLTKTSEVFTSAMQSIVRRYDDFVQRCCDVSEKLEKRMGYDIKGVIKGLHESLQDFALAQPILRNKAEEEDKMSVLVGGSDSSGAIEGFLARSFSKVHSTSTPISLLRKPGMLRTILKKEKVHNYYEAVKFDEDDDEKYDDEEQEEMNASGEEVIKSKHVHFIEDEDEQKWPEWEDSPVGKALLEGKHLPENVNAKNTLVDINNNVENTLEGF